MHSAIQPEKHNYIEKIYINNPKQIARTLGKKRGQN